MTLVGIGGEKSTLRAAERYIARVVEMLLAPPKTTPLRKANLVLWPQAPGVYGVYKGKKLMWVGESGRLVSRGKDLFRTKNHKFRRALGAKLFSSRPDFEQATSSRAFPSDIETALTQYMEERLSFLTVAVPICRKEIEERACARANGLLNVRRQRES